MNYNNPLNELLKIVHKRGENYGSNTYDRLHSGSILGEIWWSKKVYVYSNATYFYMTRFIICMVAGFVTIPIALLQTLVGKN